MGDGLWKVIEALTNKEMAAKAKDRFETERYFKRLPKGATNVEFTPEMYIDPKKPVAVVPEKTWEQNYGAANGVFSPLGGIRVPDYQSFRMPLPMVLAHENFHAIDQGQDSAPLKQADRNLQAIPSHDPRLIKGITQQAGTDELMAQMVGAEALLPAGQRIRQTPIGQAILNTPELIAAYIGRRYPKPAGVDAIVGRPE